MVFPLAVAGSLREEIDRRVIDHTAPSFKTLDLLTIFEGICRGVKVLHHTT